MKKFLLLSIFLVFSLNSAEISAFGAGSLDSDNPYGLSESEKIIFENKREIKYQARKISELKEQLEGVRSVVDSMGMKLGRTGQKISELNERQSKTDAQEIISIKEEIISIKEEIIQLKKVQSENYEKINSVLKKLSSMIDEINSNYVTKDDFNSISAKKKSSNNSSKQSKLTPGEKLKNAIALYRKKYYTKAFPIFIELAERSYKPATSNFYLGEISYYKKRYSDAIVYFKRSVSHYDKASYMPTLLLHTGISFGKLDDYANRDKFLQALLMSYPESSEAKIARKHLD